VGLSVVQNNIFTAPERNFWIARQSRYVSELPVDRWGAPHREQAKWYYDRRFRGQERKFWLKCPVRRKVENAHQCYGAPVLIPTVSLQNQVGVKNV